MRRSWLILLMALISLDGLSASETRWRIDAETGIAWSGYNDVRIPGDTGTKFSLSRELDADPAAFLRLRLARHIGRRGRLSLLLAPLGLRAAGAFDRPVAFAGSVFPSGTAIRAKYVFNSYRLTYAHRFVDRAAWTLDLGLTVKVRDAVIRLEGGGRTAEKKNVGPVPLIHFALAWNFRERLALLFEGDALAAPQGRAEDVFLGLRYSFNPSLSFKAGYRLLEGGADNDEVLTFALIHYLAAGLIWEF
jgi:hypothetical protein